MVEGNKCPWIKIATSKVIKMVKVSYNPPFDQPVLDIRLHKLVGRLLLDEELFQETTTMQLSTFATTVD